WPAALVAIPSGAFASIVAVFLVVLTMVDWDNAHRISANEGCFAKSPAPQNSLDISELKRSPYDSEVTNEVMEAVAVNVLSRALPARPACTAARRASLHHQIQNIVSEGAARPDVRAGLHLGRRPTRGGSPICRGGRMPVEA